jgi:hypothetical protein
MSNHNKSGVNGTADATLDADLTRFLTSQFGLLSEATKIDESLQEWESDISPRYAELAARATDLREQAARNLQSRICAHSTDARVSRFAAIGLLAAAYAQSEAATPFEDAVQSHAISAVLERCVANCKNAAIRDRIEDLLNLVHHRVALVEAPVPSELARAADRPTDPEPHGCDAPSKEEPVDIFGFPRM